MSKKKTLFFSSQEAVALGVPLIMEVDTTDTSSAVSASDSIILPFDEGNTVNLQIDWGDGTALEPYTDTNNICSHQYSSGGFYDIKIYNLNGVSRIPWNITNVATNRKDFSKFYDLKQFGDCEIYQLDEFDAGSFKECTNLDVTATDLGGRCVELCVNAFELFRDTSIVEAKNSANWDVSNVISFRSLVDTNTNIIIDCSNWEMSQADNIQGVFARCGNINPDVTNWDITNNCNNMQSAFLLLSNFERDLSNWDVSGVTNMQSTFSSCTSFTGQGLDTWVTSALINLQSTFFNCTNFNGNLQNFDVSGVTTMNSAFEQCTNFLGNGVDSWVTSSVLTDLRDCFDEARNFDADLSNWDVTGVTNMFQTFRLNNKFKGDGLENWVTSSLTNMYRTFDGALQFNADLSNWDATNVTNMESAFRGCSIFEGIGMNNWTTSSSLSNMANAFQSAPQFNGNLQGFNVSGVTRLEFCFFNSTSFEGGGLDTWVTSSLVNLRNTFDNTNFNQDLSGWDFSNVTDMTNWGNAWAMDTNNYDLLLLSLSTQSLNSNLSNVRMSSKYTAGEVTNGVTDGVATNKLIDSTQNFTSTVNVGDIIKKASNYAEVVTVDSNTELTLDLDIMALGDSYSVEGSNVAKARYFVVKTYNWQIIDNGQASYVEILTTSTSSTWQPQSSVKTGSLLNWEVSGDASGSYIDNRPTIDLSGNTGTAIIKITSADQLSGWSRLYVYNLDVVSSNFQNVRDMITLYVYQNQNMTDINFVGMDSLEQVFCYQNTSLTSIDFSKCPNIGNINLTSSSNISTLILGESDFSSNSNSIEMNSCNVSEIDLQYATELERLRINDNNLNSLDISNNTKLKTNLYYKNNNLPSSETEDIILNLDANGEISGNLQYSGNDTPNATKTTTNDVLNAYNSLISKGWIITGSTPS